MASKLVKLSANGRRIIFDSKRKTQNQSKSQIVNTKPLTLQKLGKRKRSTTTECKKCCQCSRKTLLKNYQNFIKSGPPQRLLFSQDGQWVDFPQDVVDLVKQDFLSKKAAIEVKLNNSHFMLQILYMIQIDLKTGTQKPIAWIDDGGICVFPESSATCHGTHDDVDLGESSLTPEIKLHLEIELNGVNKFEECMGESNVKKVKLDEGERQNDENAPEKSDEFASPVRESVCGSIDMETARKMFVEGFGGNDENAPEIIDVRKCSGSFLEAKRKLFETQVEITRKVRGKANVAYAWCVANGDATAGVLFHAHNGPKLGVYGYGVHLAALHSAHKRFK